MQLCFSSLVLVAALLLGPTSGEAPSPQVLTGGLMGDAEPTKGQSNLDLLEKKPGVDCLAQMSEETCLAPCSWDEFGCSFSKVEEPAAPIQVVRSRNQKRTAEKTPAGSSSVQQNGIVQQSDVVVRSRKSSKMQIGRKSSSLTSDGEILSEQQEQDKESKATPRAPVDVVRARLTPKGAGVIGLGGDSFVVRRRQRL